MLGVLCFEYLEDLASWTVEDEYIFGEAWTSDVYLLRGSLVDYQSAATYEGGRWHRIAAGEVPAIVLVRGAAAAKVFRWEATTLSAHQ